MFLTLSHMFYIDWSWKTVKLSTVSPNTLNWLILDVRPSLHFWDDYSLFTQYNLSYIWLDLVCRYFVEFFLCCIHKEYWSVDFVLWVLFLFWYLDNTGITIWVEMCSLTSFISSMWFSSSFFEDFLKDWHWLFFRHLIYFVDSFKMAKMSVYSLVIYLFRYSVSSWVIFYSLCVCRSLYHWAYLFGGQSCS